MTRSPWRWAQCIDTFEDCAMRMATLPNLSVRRQQVEFIRGLQRISRQTQRPSGCFRSLNTANTYKTVETETANITKTTRFAYYKNAHSYYAQIIHRMKSQRWGGFPSLSTLMWPLLATSPSITTMTTTVKCLNSRAPRNVSRRPQPKDHPDLKHPREEVINTPRQQFVDKLKNIFL